MFRVKGKSAGAQPRRAHTSSHFSAWSKEDNRALQKMLDPLRSPPKPEPFAMFGGEARGLICAPKSEVYDRIVNTLNTVNVCAALALSSTAGLCTDPLDVAGLPEEKQVLGQVYNALGPIIVATEIVVVMFSTYMLFCFYGHGHSPELNYRAIAHGGLILGACQMAIYVPLLLWLLLLVISAHIHLCFWLRWACTAAVFIIYMTGQMMFAYWAIRAFPRSMWSWLGIVAPWLFFNRRAQKDVERFHGTYLAAAASGVLAGKDEDQDGVVDDAPQNADSPEHQAMTAWIDKALPHCYASAQGVRRAILVETLMAEGLTLPRLSEAAKLPGGFRVLMEILDFSQHERAVDLTRGERLALATAAMKDASGGPQSLREPSEAQSEGMAVHGCASTPRRDRQDFLCAHTGTAPILLRQSVAGTAGPEVIKLDLPV